MVTERESALLTDLYQLNMDQAYLERGETATAVFEFFVRSLPPRRGFLLAAGIREGIRRLSIAVAHEVEHTASAVPVATV